MNTADFLISVSPSKQTVMVLLLLCSMLVIVRSLLRRSRMPKAESAIDLDDLVLEWDERAGQMRMSILRVGFIATWCLCAWVMVFLTLGGKMTEGYLGLFGALWVTPIVSAIIWGKKPPALPPAVGKAENVTVNPQAPPQ